jgi:hypothetical protein
LRCSSSWISGMTGGTASSVSRKALPASHSRMSDVMMRAGDGAALAFVVVELGMA